MTELSVDFCVHVLMPLILCMFIYFVCVSMIMLLVIIHYYKNVYNTSLGTADRVSQVLGHSL